MQLSPVHCHCSTTWLGRPSHLKRVFVVDHHWLHRQQGSHDDVLYVVEQLIGGVGAYKTTNSQPV